MMKTLILTLVTLVAVVSCGYDAETLPIKEIVPFPQHVESGKGTFDVSGAKVICQEGLDGLSKAYISEFSSHLSAVASGQKGNGRILFAFNDSFKPSEGDFSHRGGKAIP